MIGAIEENRRQALGLLFKNQDVTAIRGVTSICSAHPLVIEAALKRGLASSMPVLIEATCNQVNHEGGYTGMTPAEFRRFVEGIAKRVGFPLSRLVLGGDHLGPNPWRALPPEEAMARAEAMVAAFVAVGFAKIHLDTSMGCAGEPDALADETTAKRAARLAAVAQREAEKQGTRPVYVIGTEVPPPGGAHHALAQLVVTAPAAVEQTVAVHQSAFAAAGISGAFNRVVGVVVQPGVEFGTSNIAIYRPDRSSSLSQSLAHLPGMVYEAHSTDYQPDAALAALVDDGFAILKVGPGLTFALREALYGLDAIAAELTNDPDHASLKLTMERLMLDSPGHWQGHYQGTPVEQRLQRHFSYSDRIRYYWPSARAAAAIDRLFESLGRGPIPLTLISQYLGRLYPEVVEGRISPDPQTLCLAAIDKVLASYAVATTGCS